MFHQVYVREQDQDFLRFLWWEGGDLSSPVTEYRVMGHLFGATTSSCCSNFALKQACIDNEATLGSQVAHFVQ